MNNKRLDPAFGREDQICGHFSWGIEMCKRVDSPNVKMVCDLYHLQIMDGDLARNIQAHIDWIAHFHTAGVPTRGELDDSQEINYRYIAQVIVDTGYQGYVSHDFDPAGRDPLELSPRPWTSWTKSFLGAGYRESQTEAPNAATRHPSFSLAAECRQRWTARHPSPRAAPFATAATATGTSGPLASSTPYLGPPMRSSAPSSARAPRAACPRSPCPTPNWPC
jgi:hypothetical protein